MLFEYIKQCQRLVRDSKQDLLNPSHLISYINRARRKIALKTQSCRALTPISGTILSATVTSGGMNYTAPAAIISAPDYPSGALPFPNGFQALANVTILAGSVTSVSITNGGAGYFQPQITIADPTGSGATASLQLSWINQMASGQEVYPFSAVDMSLFPGMAYVYSIKSVSVLYANYRYSLSCYSFSTYQAMIRQYAQVYRYVPFFCAQYGQGQAGNFYLFPIPDQAYQLEWDCFCVPIELTNDQDIEAIPSPWTDAVQYYAVSDAYAELQNLNFARYYEEKGDRELNIYSVGARPGRVTNPYGRVLR
jgi:hypothetical protein